MKRHVDIYFKKPKSHFIYTGSMQSYILGDFAASEKKIQVVNRFKRCFEYLK